MKETVRENVDFERLLAPENALEKKLLLHPEIKKGLNWGIPRYGHPEGKVGLHIREVLNNIDHLKISEQERENLRLIAFIHDTFKFEENKTPRKNRTKNHGVLARQFLQEMAPDHLVLDIVEFHDEAYFAWRDIHLYHQGVRGYKRMEMLLNLIGNQRQLYYTFFKCDTQTGDKTQAPVKWFEQIVTDIDHIQF